MTIDNTLAALAFGRHYRWPVFPTRNGRPICRHGVNDATTDPEAIKRLWAACPDANISLAMGAPGGLLGLDIDVKGGRDGIASLGALEAEHGPLPPTPSYTTPSGGRGYLFKHPGGAIRTKFDFKPGLELHGAGAAMTVPPSRKNGKPYVWLVMPKDVPLADPPAWLLAAANPPPPPRKPKKPMRKLECKDRLLRYIVAAVEEECASVAQMGRDSGRNRALFVAAAKLGELVGADMLARDVAEDELEEAARKCGLAAEDGWRSVRATIASGLDRGERQPREVAL